MSKNEKRKQRMLYLDPKISSDKYKSTIPKQTRSRWKKFQLENRNTAPEQFISSEKQNLNTKSSYKKNYENIDHHSLEGGQDEDENNVPTTSSCTADDNNCRQTSTGGGDISANEQDSTCFESDFEEVSTDDDFGDVANEDEDGAEETSAEEDISVFEQQSNIYSKNENDTTSNNVDDSEEHSQNPNEPTFGLEHDDGNPKLKFVAMLLGLKVKHSLTKVCVEDICQFVNIIKGEQLLPSTYHQFKTALKDFQSPVQVHNLCPNCSKYLGQFEKNETMVCACGTESSVNVNVGKGNFFLHLPLKPQIKHLIQNRKLNLNLQRHLSKDKNVRTNIEDIQDGEMYKLKLHDIQQRVSDDKQLLTINVNTDGVPVFPSSNFSMYPVLCSINNLPPSLRKKYILLSSLWFGDKKPDMNEFLTPFVAEINELSNDGVSFVQSNNAISTCHVVCMVIICDSVARPTVQNMVQFNGKFGCSYCLHPGEVVAKGKGFCRVYPQQNVQQRTHEEWLEWVNEVETNKTVLNGIKGRAVILDVMSIDIVHSFSPDYMHSVLLGVVRQFFKLWFDSKYHEAPWYIGNKQEEVDQRLLSIKPPHYLSRTPRALKTHKFWKAHEWYNWLLYYSVVVLKGILPTKYLCHWAFLVNSIYTLLKESISKSEIHMADNSLKHFHSTTENLYGKEQSSFNLHLCTHIATSVKNWGPLWAQSAFDFENYNGVLLNMVKSSHGVSQQIMTSFQDQQILTLQNLNSSPDAELLLSDRPKSCAMDNDSQTFSCVNEVTLLGVGVTSQLSDCYRLAIISASGISIPPKEKVAYYDRIRLDNIRVCSSCYTRVTKRNSFTVLLDNKEVFQIERYVVVNSTCYALGYYFNKTNSPLLPNLPPTVKMNHIVSGRFSYAPSSVAAIEAKTIEKLIVHVNVGMKDQSFICVPPNQYEVSM